MWIEYYLSVLEQHRGEEAHVAVGDVQTPMIRHFFLQRTDVGWSERVKKGVKYHLRNKLVKKKKKIVFNKKKGFPSFSFLSNNKKRQPSESTSQYRPAHWKHIPIPHHGASPRFLGFPERVCGMFCCALQNSEETTGNGCLESVSFTTQKCWEERWNVVLHFWSSGFHFSPTACPHRECDTWQQNIITYITGIMLIFYINYHKQEHFILYKHFFKTFKHAYIAGIYAYIICYY